MATNKYLDTLLQYYEEEISGEAYFFALADHFDQKEKLRLLAKVERHAASAVEPLLKKYSLQPRPKEILIREGIDSVSRHAGLTWEAFVQYIVEQYPKYLDEFAALEHMAPSEDLGPLKQLTKHEIAAIDFAKRELSSAPDSCAPLKKYLAE